MLNQTSSCTRTGAMSAAWFLKFLGKIKKIPKYLNQWRYSSVDRVLGWGARRPRFHSPGREKFFSLKFIFKRKWTKWWTRTRTRRTQVIPWSLDDGRRQKQEQLSLSHLWEFLEIRLIKPQSWGLITASQKFGQGVWPWAQTRSTSTSGGLNRWHWHHTEL